MELKQARNYTGRASPSSRRFGTRSLLLATLLTGLSAQVFGAVQADARLGDECAATAMTELDHGAELVMDMPEQQRFQRQYLGRLADIGYRCSQGQIARITYTFWFEKYEQARQFYLDRKPSLVQRYGEPSVDQGSPGYLDYMESIGFEIKDEHRYVMLWQQHHQSITFGANRQRAGDPRSWVSIDITAKDHSH